MGGFEERVRGVLADTVNLPDDFLSMIPQYVAQNPVPLARTSGTRVASDKRTTNVTTAGLTFAGGADILANPLTFTADGKTNYVLGVAAEGWSNNTINDLCQLRINLDGADTGIFAQVVMAVANQSMYLNAAGLLVTPAVGSHTVNARLNAITGGTASINGGAGGAGAVTPIFVYLEVA